jgi:hypothetical protein
MSIIDTILGGGSSDLTTSGTSVVSSDFEVFFARYSLTSTSSTTSLDTSKYGSSSDSVSDTDEDVSGEEEVTDRTDECSSETAEEGLTEEEVVALLTGKETGKPGRDGSDGTSDETSDSGKGGRCGRSRDAWGSDDSDRVSGGRGKRGGGGRCGGRGKGGGHGGAGGVDSFSGRDKARDPSESSRGLSESEVIDMIVNGGVHIEPTITDKGVSKSALVDSIFSYSSEHESEEAEASGWDKLTADDPLFGKSVSEERVLKALMDMLDSDRNGKVNIHEVIRFISLMDSDRDGKLSRYEMEQGLGAIGAADNDHFTMEEFADYRGERSLLNALDTDRTGDIDAEEAKAFFALADADASGRMTQSEFASFFEDADADRNGDITLDEYDYFLRRRSA